MNRPNDNYISPDEQAAQSLRDELRKEKARTKRRRQIVDRLEKTMNILDGLEQRAHIYQDRNGAGQPFHVMTYTHPTTGSRHRHYLGSLPDECINNFRRYISCHWPTAPDEGLDDERIYALETMSKLMRSKMRTMAKGSGFHFHGNTLRKESE